MTKPVRKLIEGLVLAALFAAAGSMTFASTFLKEDIDSLKGRSESVVRARVADIRSYWNAEKTMIFTDVTLEVKGRLHGRADRQIVVRVPGGTVDDYTVEMEGTPEFQMNEEVVTFIGRWHDGAPMVAGYFQGLSHVFRDRAGNLMLRGGVADGLPISELARHMRRTVR